MMLSTRSLASSSARHPWRVLVGWLAITAAAVAAVVTLLGGNLATDGAPTNNPESERADAARFESFPPDPSRAFSDILVIRSEAHTVDAPQFEEFVREFAARAGVDVERTFFANGDEALVSEDRHATIVPVVLTEDDVEALVSHVESVRGGRVRRLRHGRGDGRARLQPALAGGPREGRAPVRAAGGAHHPAARVRRGRRRARAAADGDRLDRRGAGHDRSARAAVRALDLRREHAHGDGPRARDRLLAVRRLPVPRGARARARRARRDRGVRGDRLAGGALQRHGVRGRDVRDAARAELDHALAGGGRDPRRDRVRGRGADAAAGRAGADRRRREPVAHPDRRAPLARGVDLRGRLLGRDRAARARAAGPLAGALRRASSWRSRCLCSR